MDHPKDGQQMVMLSTFQLFLELDGVDAYVFGRGVDVGDVRVKLAIKDGEEEAESEGKGGDGKGLAFNTSSNRNKNSPLHGTKSGQTGAWHW